ncbi:L-rhamnose/proton symporter RhaT [Halosquirtibacter laminarini]|uniref:L-rhamnose/proton symporter RhaT n=1 Tax=Halosquirtibacter laminarini TaxID=3374600 RepID=A0AC61NR03_9BACT|nr:L-rhamnose/proton symporter RhaT [Prolixibacteraceae bacterium]
MSSLSAIGMIAIGSLGAASFYVPLKKIKNWAWESYWIFQGIAAWIVAPWLFAYLTVPDGTLVSIIKEAPMDSILLTIFFGILWGVGGLCFGLSIRYLGIALGQSIALGFCAAFGTLIPPLIAGKNLLTSTEGILMIVGVSVCIIGIILIGYAGALKTIHLSEEERKKAIKEFALKKGLIIALIAGLMSAAFSYGFIAGKPIDKLALRYGINPLFQSNPTLIFILSGGFLTNFIYCVFLNIKNKTYRDYTTSSSKVWANNIIFTFLAGILWFLQFHFYGMGKSQMTISTVTFSWSILMALNIAIGNIWGIFLGEWKGTTKTTKAILILGILVLILSTFVISLK